MGNSGTGKSSMLRAVAGLWDRGSGEVARPPTASTMFLPQRPYCTLGSLRQQLVYPQTVDAWKRTSTDYTLLSALETVQLGRLAAFVERMEGYHGTRLGRGAQPTPPSHPAPPSTGTSAAAERTRPSCCRRSTWHG